MRPIAALAGIAIETRSLDAMTDFYAEAFGLTILTRTANRVEFAGRQGAAPQLTLHESPRRGLAELHWAMRTREDIDASAAALAAAGVEILAAPHEGERGYGFAIADPDGTRLRFTVLPWERPLPIEDNDRPLLMSHVVLNSVDAPHLVDFYTRVLGLTVSDAYERELLTFLRCDQPQHHCLGISPGPVSGLNHFAMDCGDIDALMRGVGRMKQRGQDPVWGPGRHGPGGNIFCYYADPDGFVPEFTCDVMQIEDPARWQAREWARTPANGNVWGTGAPTKRAVDLMAGVDS